MTEKKINKDSSNNKKGPQKPKIASYWIYIAIAVVFLGLQFINISEPVDEIGQLKLEQLIKQRSVSKIIVVNRERAEIFLKAESPENTAPQPQKANSRTGRQGAADAAGQVRASAETGSRLPAGQPGGTGPHVGLPHRDRELEREEERERSGVPRRLLV